MQQLQWGAWLVPPSSLSAPAWLWPVAVCLAGWLFRRYLLGGRAPVSSIRFPRFASLWPSGPVPRSGAAGPPCIPIIQEGGSEERAQRVPWWKSFRNRIADPERIEVPARRTLGPQLQFLILRAGNREYHVLSQAGVAPQVLATRIVSSMQTASDKFETSGTGCVSKNARKTKAGRHATMLPRRSGRGFPDREHRIARIVASRGESQ